MGWKGYETNRGYWNTAIAMYLIAFAGIIATFIQGEKRRNNLEGKTYRERAKSYMEVHRQRKKVLDYVDKDSNGLSFSEDYKIKELMRVEDSSKTYKPTLEDWKRAYESMKQKREQKQK